MAYIPGRNDKSRGIDATNRGAARWERAARNALRNPHSATAALYRRRYDLALTVSAARRMTGGGESAWQFIGARGHWDSATNKWVPKRERLYATCSTFCTVLQMTLDFGVRDLDGAARAFALTDVPETHRGTTVEPVLKGTLARDMKCYVCTKKIKKS